MCDVFQIINVMCAIHIHMVFIENEKLVSGTHRIIAFICFLWKKNSKKNCLTFARLTLDYKTKIFNKNEM